MDQFSHLFNDSYKKNLTNWYLHLAMVKTYKKGAEKFSAVQFTGKNKFLVCELLKGIHFDASFPTDSQIDIWVNESQISLKKNDFLIKDENDSYFSCNGSQFKKEYSEDYK
jgi:hypothetical protein